MLDLAFGNGVAKTNTQILKIAKVDFEAAIFLSKVEKLIQEMKTANLESLTISPPEESKAFLDGKISQHTTPSHQSCHGNFTHPFSSRDS